MAGALSRPDPAAGARTVEPPAVPDLVHQACAASGLDDWGDLDFVATVERLVSSCQETARLTAAGWTVLTKVLVRHLRNRLYLEQYRTAHPGVAARAIRAPVLITGLPRTGTTLLHNLLAQDPANRVLRVWEALHPVPAVPGDERHSKRRLVAQAAAWLERLYVLSPELPSIHRLAAEGPEECDALLQNSFTSQHFDDMFCAVTYSEWLNDSPLRAEYEYYAFQLRALTPSPGAGQRWVLKSPGHLGYLDTLRGCFPDALVVHCHRAPVEVVPSYASLVMAVRSPHAEFTSPHEVGRHALRRCAVATTRAVEARSGATEDRFLDLGYRVLLHDPMRAVDELYERLGQPLAPRTRAAMAEWLADNPQHAYGVHRYHGEAFGLSREQIVGDLAPYLELFGRYCA